MIALLARCVLLPELRPNVLVFVVEGLGADRTGGIVDDPSITPCLEGLASEGSVFAAVVPHGFSGTPALAPDSTHSPRPVDARPNGGLHSLASSLLRRGWTTGALIRRSRTQGPHSVREGGLQSFGECYHRVSADSASPALVRRAWEWIESVGEAPWFCLVSFADLEDTPRAPGPPSEDVGQIYPRGLRSVAQPPGSLGLAESRLAPGLGGHRERLREFDRQLCALVDSLATRGLASNLLVVVLGTRSGESSEAGAATAASKAPLLLWWPGRIPAGRCIQTPLEDVDVVGTVLDLLGIPSPPGRLVRLTALLR